MKVLSNLMMFIMHPYFHLNWFMLISSQQPMQPREMSIYLSHCYWDSPSDYQYGYIVLANSDTYLYNIELAYILSWIVLVTMFTSITALICVNMKYHDDGIGNDQYKANKARMRWLQDRRSTTNNSIHKSIELTSISNTFTTQTQTSTKPLSPEKRLKILKIGDKATTKDGKTGTIVHMTSLLENKEFALIGLELENGKTVFTNMTNIVPQYEFEANDVYLRLNAIKEDATSPTASSDAKSPNTVDPYSPLGIQSQLYPQKWKR